MIIRVLTYSGHKSRFGIFGGLDSIIPVDTKMDYGKVFGLPSSVKNWVEALELPFEVYQTLEASGYVSLLSCAYLEESDVRELGIALPGHRRTLLAGAAQLKSTLDRIKSKIVQNESLPDFPEPPSIPVPSMTPRSRTPICNSAVPRGVAPDYWDRARSRDRFQDRVKSPDGIHLMLVRHAQSLANVDMKYYTTHSDYSVPLSEAGIHQAAETGRQIAAYYRRKYQLHQDAPPPGDWLCRIWTSPYVRTRQTSKLIMENSGGWITDIQENVLLVEQNFGLFEGVDWYSGELDDKYPDELHHYQKAAAFGGRFWAKIPLGESRFDVCMRVSQSFGTIHRDVSRCNIRNFVIVSHGTTLRAFMMMWLRLLPEWFEEEPNPTNASVRVIDDYQDEGYIWPPPQDENDCPVLDNSLLNQSRIQVLDQRLDSESSNPLKEMQTIPKTEHHRSQNSSSHHHHHHHSHHHSTTPRHTNQTQHNGANGVATPSSSSSAPNSARPSIQDHFTSPGQLLAAFESQYGGSEDALLRSSASIRPVNAAHKLNQSAARKQPEEKNGHPTK